MVTSTPKSASASIDDEAHLSQPGACQRLGRPRCRVLPRDWQGLHKQLHDAKENEAARTTLHLFSLTHRPKFTTTPCSGAWVRGETDGRIIETHLAEDDVPYVNLGGLLLDRVDPILRCYSLEGGARCHTEARTTLKRLGPCQATNGHRKCGAAACRMTPPLRDLNIVGNVGR